MVKAFSKNLTEKIYTKNFNLNRQITPMAKTKAENNSRRLILQAIGISSAQNHSFIK